MSQSIDEYIRAGRAAGRARAQGDEGLAQHELSWFKKALPLENIEHQRACQFAFQDAYRDASKQARGLR